MRTRHTWATESVATKNILKRTFGMANKRTLISLPDSRTSTLMVGRCRAIRVTLYGFYLRVHPMLELPLG